MGGPATAGKRWPHFFQMGKLRHKEVWDLAQVTHSESAFGEGAAHTLGNKVTQASVTSPLGRRQAGRARGPRAAWRGVLGCSEGPGEGRPGEGLCLALGRAKSSVGEQEGGHSGENSVSGKTGIHFKISAQKGQQGCSQARLGPPVPTILPTSPAAPRKDPGAPGGLLGETPPLLRGRGGRGDAPTVL